MKVGELYGYTIEYNTSIQQFEAWKDGEITTSAPTQVEVEEFIKKLHEKGFKRIKAIQAKYEDVTIGEITSIKKTAGRYREIEVWFVSQDGARQKIYLTYVYEATPKNLEIAEKIRQLADKQKKVLEQIRELTEKLTDPITEKNIYKLAGLEG